MAVLTVTKASGAVVSLPDDTLTLSVDIYDLDSEEGSGRNRLGEQFRDRVAVKRKINCEWGLLTPSEMSQILSATEDEFFTLLYPDPKTGKGEKKTFYVGDRSAPLFRSSASVTNGGSLSGWWEGLSMNFIEK